MSTPRTSDRHYVTGDATLCGKPEWTGDQEERVPVSARGDHGNPFRHVPSVLCEACGVKLALLAAIWEHRAGLAERAIRTEVAALARRSVEELRALAGGAAA